MDTPARPDAPQMRRVIYTLADGREYTDVDPYPCQWDAYMYLDAAGEPYGLMVDGKAYRIRHSPRLRVPTHPSVVFLGRRLNPDLTP